jgi:hypothetical protein
MQEDATEARDILADVWEPFLDSVLHDTVEDGEPADDGICDYDPDYYSLRDDYS